MAVNINIQDHDEGKSEKGTDMGVEAPINLNPHKEIIRSPGVQRIDAISSCIDLPLKIAFFISVCSLRSHHLRWTRMHLATLVLPSKRESALP